MVLSMTPGGTVQVAGSRGMTSRMSQVSMETASVGQMAMQWPQLKHGPKISACPSLTAMV